MVRWAQCSMTVRQTPRTPLPPPPPLPALACRSTPTQTSPRRYCAALSRPSDLPTAGSDRVTSSKRPPRASGGTACCDSRIWGCTSTLKISEARVKSNSTIFSSWYAWAISPDRPFSNLSQLVYASNHLQMKVLPLPPRGFEQRVDQEQKLPLQHERIPDLLPHLVVQPGLLVQTPRSAPSASDLLTARNAGRFSDHETRRCRRYTSRWSAGRSAG